MTGMKSAWPTLLILLSFTAESSAQNFEDIKRSLSTYSSSVLQEKIYVHTDKSFYLAGESIWLKIYQVDGATNKSLDISKIVYVEIIDAAKKPILQVKIGAQNGMADGAISLPTSTETGKYFLRAYTSWMQNFAADYYFQKEITIINTFKKPDWKKLETQQEYSAQFFPEGGNLVAGVENKVAFKIADASGRGLIGKGFLVNDNDTIISFETRHSGMGSLQFVPQVGKTYKAILVVSDGKTVISELPRVYEQGYVLNLTSSSEREKLVVKVSAKNVNDQQLYLLVHSSGKIKISEVLNLQNGNAAFELDKNRLGDGISHLTLFNERKQPVCERLYFKHPTKELAISIASEKKTYLKREKIRLQVASGKSVPANLSLAVHRLDTLHQPETENIKSYLWLSSDLTGMVENPNYYFEHPEDTASVDLVMMTNGWRRFEWNDVLRNNKPVFRFIPEYEGQVLKGTITNESGIALSSTPIQISYPDTNFLFVHSKSDNNGQVLLPIKNFAGNRNIVIQTGTATRFRFNPQSSFSEKYSFRQLSALSISESAKEDLLIAYQAMQVQNIYKPSNQISTTPDLTYTPFYTKPDKVYMLDEYTRFPSMEEVLKEYVSEVRMRGQKEDPTLNVLNVPFKTFFDLPPLILVDGVPVPNPSKLLALDPLNVKKIDIVAQKYHYGPITNNGIISVRTYKGDMGGLELDPNAIVLEYESLQEKRIFYSPIYDTESLRQSRLPDFRTLLYWSPNIHIGADGTSSIEFFTSDVKGKYVVVVEGLSNDGAPGTNTFSFEVVK